LHSESIVAIFQAKFVSVALSLSGFTVGFAMKNGCAIVLQELETMEWPADWRHVTIAAADCLALRIIDHSSSR
jgi:hypothetical protein